jgi:glycosyltransferase involved in cell wall biosynthesis
VDRALFTAGSKVHRQDLVLFVGRLVEKKGCKYLIEAMDVVQKKRKDIRLVIIGDGPLRQSLESLTREKGIVCQFLRQPANPVIREWLGRAAGILWTEYYRRQRSQEGLPIVLTEAQAMGVPVVSSIHAGIPEAVRHGETGLLAPEHEHEILAGHILQYLSDKPFWRRCSEAAPNGLDIASICTRKPASLKAFMLA